MTARETRVGQVYEPGKVRFLRRELRPLAPDEALIRVRASAICGSDVHIARGKHPSAPLPVTIGHEFSGDLVELGEAVQGFRTGDRVTVEPCTVCGKCEACRRGDYNDCENIRFTYRDGDGAMADYVIVRESQLYRLPEGMPYEVGALMEPMAVATHGVRRAGVKLGDTVLILGAGPIGLLTAAMCRKAGAQRIFISDGSPERLALAKELGATDAIDRHTDEAVEAVMRLTGGRGVDISFECVGRESCLHQALFALRKGGTAVVAGIYEEADPSFPVGRLVTHELHVLGTQGYCRDFPIVLRAAQELPMEKLISHVFPLSQLQQAIDAALDPKVKNNKIVILPDGGEKNE